MKRNADIGLYEPVKIDKCRREAYFLHLVFIQKQYIVVEIKG